MVRTDVGPAPKARLLGDRQHRAIVLSGAVGQRHELRLTDPAHDFLRKTATLLARAMDEILGTHRITTVT